MKWAMTPAVAPPHAAAHTQTLTVPSTEEVSRQSPLGCMAMLHTTSEWACRGRVGAQMSIKRPGHCKCQPGLQSVPMQQQQTSPHEEAAAPRCYLEGVHHIPLHLKHTGRPVQGTT